MSEEHAAIARKGRIAYQRWRDDHLGETFDVANCTLGATDLSGLDLHLWQMKGVNLNGANLTDANLKGLNLDGGQFKNANLERATLTCTSLRGATLDGAQLRSADLSDSILIGVSANGAQLVGTTMTHVDATGSSWIEANAESANLTRTRFDKSQMKGFRAQKATLVDCSFESCAMDGATLSQCDLTGAKLARASLVAAALDGARLQSVNRDRQVTLDGAVLKRVALNLVDMTSMRLAGLDLAGAAFQGTQLAGADLSGAKLEGAKFFETDLVGANLMGATFDYSTGFRGARVERAQVERFTLECLEDYGGLTVGARMQMDVRDGLAELTANYSGFWQYIHVVAVLLFVSPYAWFVAQHWVASSFSEVDAGNSITIGEGLIRYIVSGGVGWREGLVFRFVPTAIFAYFLGYNALRLVLLFKTKSLELRQAASGLPPRFTLEGPWGIWLDIAHVGMVINLIVVLWHTAHFMSQRFPL